MPRIFNYSKVKTEKKESPIGEYSWATTEDIAQLANLHEVSCNIRCLDRGKYSYPYHFHHNAEEVFVILSGSGKLRTPDGISVVESGDIVLFEKGETGAHQIFNSDDAPLVYLDLRTVNKIDVCEYPDTGKINLLPERDIFFRGEKADYFEGEKDVRKIWDALDA